MMKILVAVHHFPPCRGGGAEWRTHRIVKGLRARGHDARVLCVERVDADLSSDPAWEDKPYDDIPVRRLFINLAAAPNRFRWEYDNPWIGNQVRCLLNAHQPDVFHLIGGYLISGSALRAAQRQGIPTVLSLTDYWFLCPRITMLRSDGQLSTLPIDARVCARCLGEQQRRYRWPGRFAPRLMEWFWRLRRDRIRQLEQRMKFLRATLDRVDVILASSVFLRSVFVGAGLEPRRILLSPKGCAAPQRTQRLADKSPRSALRVGYLGQITWSKGIHVLFEAARRMPNAAITVEVYGDPTPDPPYTTYLRRLAEGDARLRLAGVYPRDELTEVLDSLDVVVIPSIWYESAPNVILEAFAHRVPVLVSDVEGIAEMIRDGQSGLLFARGDAASLACQIRRLLQDPALLPTLRAGIPPVRTVEQEIDEIEEVYRRVTSSGSGNRPCVISPSSSSAAQKASE